ncbi:hypothetical protein ACFL2Q_08350 [Thermodesulfobacteriota bacterium]
MNTVRSLVLAGAVIALGLGLTTISSAGDMRLAQFDGNQILRATEKNAGLSNRAKNHEPGDPRTRSARRKLKDLVKKKKYNKKKARRGFTR